MTTPHVGTPEAPSPSERLQPGSDSRIIQADPIELYHRIADVCRTPEWDSRTVRCEWVGAETVASAGASFTAKVRSGPFRRTRTFEVVTAEPGREFTFRSLPGRQSAVSIVRQFLFDVAAGGTRLTYSAAIGPGLLSRRQAAGLITKYRIGRPYLTEELDLIAAAAEGRIKARQPRLGQAHTAEGPLDLSAMFVMHHGFRRDLRDLSATVPATPIDDHDAWAALADYWANLATTLHHHHQVEDRWIWPPLLDRVNAVGDVEGRHTLQAMAAEHSLIDPLLEECAAGFTAMAESPSAAGRALLAANAGRMASLLTDHLAHEESGALPLAQRHLSVAAWKDSELAARKEFGIGDLGFTVPWSAREIPADQFDIAYAHGGAMVRGLLALTRRRFDRRHRSAFRHLPAA